MIYFLILIFIAFLGFYLYTLKFRNPYKLIMIFGKKGCGKSTTLCKLALQHIKKGWTVYSTEPIPGTYLISPSDIGFVQLQPHSVLLVDEVGMVWDNRNFKNFRPEVRDFFKLQRHYKIKCYLFSQTFDIDKKLRDLTDEMYLLTNKFRVFSYGKRILKKIVLNDSTADSPSSIAENLAFDSLFWFWAGSRSLTYIPKWQRYFDSFVTPELPYKELPLNLPHSLQERRFVLCDLRKLKSMRYVRSLLFFLRRLR